MYVVLVIIRQVTSIAQLEPTTASPSINTIIQLSGPSNSSYTAKFQSTYLSATPPSLSFPSRSYALWILFLRVIGINFEIIRPPVTSIKLFGSRDFSHPFSSIIPIIVSTRNLLQLSAEPLRQPPRRPNLHPHL